jgi:outer membrane protein
VSAQNSLRTAVLGLVLLFATGALYAQAPESTPPVSKIGFINLLQAISLTAEGKQAGNELQSQFLPRQQELAALDKQVNDLRQRMNSQPPPSDTEAARISSEGARLQQRLERKQNEYQEDLNAAQADAVNGIGRKMMEVVDRYAQEKGYVQVIDSSAQNSPVLFVAPGSDITQDIVRLYDQAHPVKAASATPAAKPAAAAKPTAATASKPR